jgi:Mrp family chromosome partitioning ATPase
MRELIDVVRGHFDLVLVDSPPVSAALDVAILAGLVDGVALVVKAGSTSRILVRKVRDRLRGAKANLVGVILTSAEVTAEDLGAYGYRYDAEKSSGG